MAVWNKDKQIHQPFTHFSQQIKEAFEYPAGGRDVQLLFLCQGKLCGAYYAIQFHTLAVESGWNDITLMSMFHEGLNPTLQAELAYRDESLNLSEYVTLAIKIDNLMHNQPHSSTRKQLSASASSLVTLYHDSVGPCKSAMRGCLRGNASADEMRGYAFIAVHPGHHVSTCPNKTRPSVGSSQGVRITFNSISSQNFTLAVTILAKDHQSCVTVLENSGAALNLFINR